MIIEEYDESMFISRFEDYKRVVTSENKNGNFTYKGLRCLFNSLNESYTEETPYKLDVIALCCEFSEYANIEEYLKDYSNQHEEKQEDENEDEFNKRIEEEINDKTSLIKFDEDINEGFIISSY
jgi:hypothetical protein